MNFLIDAFKGSLTNILVVVGVAILVPVVLPVVVTMARPVVKGLIKGGMALADKAQEFVAGTGEPVSDLMAEVRAERAAGQGRGRNELCGVLVRSWIDHLEERSIYFVADDFAFNQVDDFFGNISGMVGDALQFAGNSRKLDEAIHPLRKLADAFLNSGLCLPVYDINFIVFFTNPPGQFRVHVYQRVQTAFYHGQDFFRHFGVVERNVDFRAGSQRHGPFGDIDR